MHTKPAIDATGRRRTVLATLLSVIRGDKHMADAYAPDAAPGPAPAASPTKER